MLSISKIWNASIELGRPEKPVEARDRLWASELGKSDLDNYLKLIGEPVSNAFDSRAKRKFEAGNLFEWIVQLILIRAGVFRESQKWVGFETPGQVKVTGKLDHLIGGVANYDQAKAEIEALGLPESFTKASEAILQFFKDKFPEGLPEQGIEVKSTSSYGIEKVYFTGKGLAGHDLQAFHYAHNLNLPFTLLYICRDDLRMAEIPIMPDDQDLLKLYNDKIARVSKYYFAKEEPAPEPPIIFDEDTQKFTKNFMAEYSSYLTRNYAVENPEEFNEKYGGTVEAWNRVIGRVKAGKDMTANNLEKIKDMESWGFDISTIKVNNDEDKQTVVSESGNTAEATPGLETA